MITDELKAMAAAAILNKTFESSFFSICAVRDAAEMLGRNPHCEEFTLLYGLHCVSYAKMPRELREKIPGLVALCLGLESQSSAFQPVALDIKLLDDRKLTKPKNKFLSWIGVNS